MVSLIVQQMYREILAVADENDGRLKNRVMMYLDEFGTIPKIEGAEMMFSASRSRRVSIVAIIQSFAQLQKNYGKEGCEIITDNTQLTVFGGFAPNSESAQVLSKALGSRTVQSGSVNRAAPTRSPSPTLWKRASSPRRAMHLQAKSRSPRLRPTPASTPVRSISPSITSPVTDITP